MNSFGGFHTNGNNLLFVNLSESSIIEKKMSGVNIANYLGGRGFGSYVLYQKTPAGVYPFGKKNSLIFSTGPLTGTRFPGTTKAFVTTKSLLTGTIPTSV